RVRRGDRLAHQRNRRGRLWRLHRAWPRYDDAVDSEHCECIFWHLLPEICRNDLRVTFRTDLLYRNGARLCWCGGNEIHYPRAHHPCDGFVIRAAAGCPPILDGELPSAHRGDI